MCVVDDGVTDSPADFPSSDSSDESSSTIERRVTLGFEGGCAGDCSAVTPRSSDLGIKYDDGGMISKPGNFVVSSSNSAVLPDDRLLRIDECSCTARREENQSASLVVDIDGEGVFIMEAG